MLNARTCRFLIPFPASSPEVDVIDIGQRSALIQDNSGLSQGLAGHPAVA
jgi:hypothetical protein